jgi:hypothetical protein
METRKLLLETNMFITEISLFYKQGYYFDINKKMQIIDQLNNLMAEINGHPSHEVPFRILGIRRVLTSSLPYIGHSGYKQFASRLDRIMTACRVSLTAKTKEPSLA